MECFVRLCKVSTSDGMCDGTEGAEGFWLYHTSSIEDFSSRYSNSERPLESLAPTYVIRFLSSSRVCNHAQNNSAAVQIGQSLLPSSSEILHI
jgi:hypothetical protein